MATTTHVPVEVYLRSSYEPDAEYVDGKIEERPMGSSITHLGKRRFYIGFRTAKMGGMLVRCRRCGLRSRLHVIVFPMLPCLTVVSRGNKSLRTRRLLSSRFYPLKTRCSVSNANWKTTGIMGIAEIRVIDPQDNTYYRYENGQLLRNDTFSHAGKGIVFDMNQIKDLLDE